MKASSLYSLIADEKYRNTSLGRDTWKKLIGSGASLQRYCNTEGFNVISGGSVFSKARIGITTNNQNHCNSCDSRIGFGTGGKSDDSNTCGNEALVSRIMEINTLKPGVTFWFTETKEKHGKFIEMLRLDSERFSNK